MDCMHNQAPCSTFPYIARQEILITVQMSTPKSSLDICRPQPAGSRAGGDVLRSFTAVPGSCQVHA